MIWTKGKTKVDGPSRCGLPFHNAWSSEIFLHTLLHLYWWGATGRERRPSARVWLKPLTSWETRIPAQLMTFAPGLCLIPAGNLHFCLVFILFWFVLFYLSFRLFQRPHLQKMTCSKYHPSGDWFHQSSNLIVKDFPESNSNLRKRKQKENLFPNNSLKCNLKVTKMVCVANARNLRLSLEVALTLTEVCLPFPSYLSLNACA